MRGAYARARRVKRSPAARIRPFWAVLTLVGLVLAGGLAFVVTWPGFDAKRVSVTGNRVVSTDEILARAEIPSDRSIWLINAGAVAARVAAIPDVSTVRIVRTPPGSVSIAVRERVPFAVLRASDVSAVVDDSLRVLSSQATERGDLPVLVTTTPLALEPGTFVKEKGAFVLRDAYATMARKGIFPRVIAFDRYGGLVATLPNGLRLLLGEPGDLSQRLALANAIMTQVVRGRRAVSAVDVRAPSTPVVVYR